MARGERGACPAGSGGGCISFQQFHLGYVWMNGYTARFAVFCPDLDTDGTVGFTDLYLFAKAYGSQPGDPQWTGLADINGDASADFSDLLIFSGSYGLDCHP